MQKRLIGLGVVAPRTTLAVLVASCLTVTGLARAQSVPRGGARAEVALVGQVTSMAEGPMEGVVVTAKRDASTEASV